MLCRSVASPPNSQQAKCATLTPLKGWVLKGNAAKLLCSGKTCHRIRDRDACCDKVAAAGTDGVLQEKGPKETSTYVSSSNLVPFNSFTD